MEKTLFRVIDAMPSWQLSALCVVLTEAIVSAMSLLFHGYVASDYLVTGFVASLFVSYSILKILSVNRAQLEERVRNRTSALRVWDTAIATSVTAFATAELDGKIAFANQAWLKLFGYENERDVEGRSIFDFWRDPDKVQAALDELTRDGHWSGELAAVRRDGSTRDIHLTTNIVFDEEERPICMMGSFHDMTERNRLMEKLRSNEARLREILDSVFGFIGIFNLEGKAIYYNRVVTLATGVPLEEVLGAPFWEAYWWSYSPQVQDEVREAMERAAAGEVVNWTKAARIKPEGMITVEATFGPLRDEAGAVTRIIGFGVDVTERKRAEEAQRQSEARLHEAQRLAKIGSWELDLVNNSLVWSEEIFRIFEIDKEKFGASYEAFLNAVHPDDRDAVNTAFTDSLENRTRYEICHRLLMPDGRVKWVEESCVSFFDEAGRPLRSLGTVQDITERKRAEEQLRKLSLAVEQSSNIIIITNTDGIIEYVNPKFTEVTGYSAEEAIGRTPALLGSRLTDKEKYERFWSALLAGQEWHGEFLNRKKNGDVFWCEESIAPIHDSDGQITHFVAVETDITERRKTAEQLQQAQKMETAGRLAGGIAHDFNNLLTIIQGNLELLLEKQTGSPEGRKLADRALHATGRSAELVSQLLVFSRQQFLHPQAVDVGTLIGKMKDLLHSTLMEKIAVKVSMPDDLWHALADPTQLENAIINLALNARDAMPDGGTLSIEAENVEFAPDRLPADFDVAPGPFVRIKVADSGTGMPPSVLERAFEPFFTTKDVGRGSGLGLSMVYGFVKQSGGHIEIESAPDRGTAISLHLPRTELDRAGKAPAEKMKTEGAGETILVVEDNAEVRELAVMFLKELGYKVIEARDGHAALASLKSKDTVDLLFTDIVMPGGISGAELARRALELRPGLKLLFTTGYAEETEADGSAFATGAEVLAKPYRKHQLAQTVRDALKAPAPHRNRRPVRAP